MLVGPACHCERSWNSRCSSSFCLPLPRLRLACHVTSRRAFQQAGGIRAMRFLIADALNGACFAAIIVFAAGHAQKIATAPISGAVVPAQEGTQRSGSVVQAAAERVPKTEDVERNVTGGEESDRP